MKLFNLFPLRLIKGAIFLAFFDVLSKSTSGPSEKRLTISSALASKKFVRASRWVDDRIGSPAGAKH